MSGDSKLTAYQKRKEKFNQIMAACNGYVDPNLTYSRFRSSRRPHQEPASSQENRQKQPASQPADGDRSTDFDDIDPNVDIIPATQESSGEEQDEDAGSDDPDSEQPANESHDLENDDNDSFDNSDGGQSDDTTDCELELGHGWKELTANNLISEVSDIYTKYKLSQACVMRIFELASDINNGNLPMKASDVPRNFTSFKNALTVERRFQITCYTKCMVCDGDVWNSFVVQKGNATRVSQCRMGHPKKRSDTQFHYIKVRDLFVQLLPKIHRRLDLETCNTVALQQLRHKVGLQPDDVVLQISTDGFPVFKGSNGATWPFLSSFVGASRRLKKGNGTILHGVYQAKHFNRDDMCKMLTVILKDIMKTVEKPICWRDDSGAVRRTRVYVLNLVADSPGRADVMNMQHHTATFGCNYCYQEQAGHYYSLQNDVQRRTHESYKTDALLGTCGNPYRGQKGPSPLEVLPYFDVILGCPPDPMHAVFIGVSKLLLEATFTSKFHQCWFHIRKALQRPIDDDLASLQLPRRIARKPDKIEKCLNWKASEYYLWTLYLGPVLLKDRLESAAYEVFVTFSHAISLLVSSDLNHGKLELAKITLQVFVQDFHRVYTHGDLGETLRRFNIHLMEHLAEYVELYGQLYNFDMTTFENKIGQIKKYVTGSQFSIQQMLQKYLIALLCEDPMEIPVTMQNCISKPFELRGPLEVVESRHEGSRFKKLVVTSAGGRTYKAASKHSVADDSCFFVGSDVIKIGHFLVQTQNGKKVYNIVGTRYQVQPFRTDDLMLYHIKSVVGKEADFKLEIKSSIELIPAIKVTTKSTNQFCFCKFLNHVDLNVE